MFRVYFVAQTDYGIEVQGPNGHRWTCKADEGRSRAVGFAKALERAYLEGQKSITMDAEIAVGIEALDELVQYAPDLSSEAILRKLASLAGRTDKARKKLASIRFLNHNLQAHQPQQAEEADDDPAS